MDHLGVALPCLEGKGAVLVLSSKRAAYEFAGIVPAGRTLSAEADLIVGLPSYCYPIYIGCLMKVAGVC